MSDPAELSAPRDPGSYGRGRLAGAGFWALIAFGVLCVAAGYGAARFGPGFFPAPPAKSQPAAAASFFGATPDAVPAPPPPPKAPVAAPTSSAEVARLAERLEALEGRQGRAAEAAAGALATSALMEAAQTSRPFPAELTALEQISPAAGDLRALKPYAERGVPSRAALSSSFPEYAARAAAAARASQDDESLLSRVGAALSRVVTLRRVGDVEGKSVDAVIARAERQLEDGDLVSALGTLDALPPSGRGALAPWRERAEGRAAVDRRIAEIRSQALKSLADIARSDG